MNISDEEVISALLTEPTIKRAADKCQLSQRQIHERMKNADFQKQYKAAKSQILETTTAALQSQISKSTETVIKIMNDPKNAPQIRLNAADMIFRHCMKLTETVDIIQRIEVLEAMQETDNEY
ncbi:MAG: hypothetical protein IJ192_01770 [Clostridia bacterium]|nr:hypothetical protein [Clostridia bacterium]